MKENQNILVCPLEWGLGHAARIIPLVLKLREMGFNIIAGSGEKHLAFLREEIPGINSIIFPGFEPRYSKYFPQYIYLLFQLPYLVWHSFREHFTLRRIIRENHIDMVISDNRFGLWNRKITTVYITHQPRIPFPGAFRIFEFIGIWIHKKIISKYTYCFIPDLPCDLNLSGRLSHGVRLPGNATYIGILSRFADIGSGPDDLPAPDVQNTIILSGPEPQKTILRENLTEFFGKTRDRTVLLGGDPAKDTCISLQGNIFCFNHLPAVSIKELLIRSKVIVSRPGYTTIMELASIGCNAILIPTPGQTEQEYLAVHLSKRGWFSSVSQKKASDALPPVPEQIIPSAEINKTSRHLLDKALLKLLKDQQ